MNNRQKLQMDQPKKNLYKSSSTQNKQPYMVRVKVQDQPT